MTPNMAFEKDAPKAARLSTLRWALMKRIIPAFFIALPVLAQSDETAFRRVYLDFESAYLSNNAEAVDKWLSPDVRLSQTLHIPSGETDTVKASRAQLIASMQKQKAPNKTPRSKAENVRITAVSDGFCGTSETKAEVVVTAKLHEEREVRKVCFKSAASGYQVTEQTIDVFYKLK